ncbi:uncharacterized protein BX663DRAFT_525598 [Cokeromyces recurvatus]|uniref:uncharacterized protein n=1 Tax=Cokeromyces recurvatus TaxID=90255 RepID=UPI00221FA051|nr:uncharacterized protein BX663DRAFT_525598 [Cokeromyces recurvatus]KAI7898213.1 hypothetical protein BX663DRAFT_525598 [Cokeromyces recurvatus]
MSDSPPLTDSDTSDTERDLATMLDTYMKGKQVENPFMSNTIVKEEKESMAPQSLTSRVKRASNEHIRILSSEMIHYLKQHEFKGKGEIITTEIRYSKGFLFSISQVRGSKGKTYTVTIGPKIQCTCVDHTMRAIHCKHILYILLKELQVQNLSSIIYLTLFPSDQVK